MPDSSMKEGTFEIVYRSGANAGIIERSKCGRRYSMCRYATVGDSGEI